MKRIACLVLLSASAFAAEEINLYPGVAPGSEGLEVKEMVQQRGGLAGRRISEIAVPTLTVHLPPKENANGAAVIICPGGGYGGVVVDKEGHKLAEWLNTFGVAGLVLKYRLPNAGGKHLGHQVPLMDAQRAIRIVRHRAREWNIAADHIGIMGFSAGGHLAATASTLFDSPPESVDDPAGRLSARPDFSILVYPVITFSDIGHGGSRRNLLGKQANDPRLIKRYSAELNVTAKSPPAFLVHTYDDGVKIQNSMVYKAACEKAGVPVQAAFYDKGGHGYGLNPTGAAVDAWPRACKAWLEQRGIVPAPQ